MERDTFADTTSATATLGGVRLRDKRLDETTDLSFLIEPHLAVFARVDHGRDVGNRDTRLGNVAVGSRARTQKKISVI